MKSKKGDNKIDQYSPEEWRFGFEVELLFGSLGLKKYKDEEEAGGFDRTPVTYCEEIANRLSEATGEKWHGSEQTPDRTGLFVIPEYDLDPTLFPEGAIAGVELVTPPLPTTEAEELRIAIIEATEFEGGFVPPDHPQVFGWHVNADKLDAPHRLTSDPTLSSLTARDLELDLLFKSNRYATGHTSPQHHAFGPRLLTNMRGSLIEVTQRDIREFVDRHRGRGKQFASNLSKLEERGYVELRHLGLNEFMDLSHTTSDFFGSILGTFNSSYDAAAASEERLYNRFRILGEWLDQLWTRLKIEVTSGQHMMSKDIHLILDGRQIAHGSWNGATTLYLDHNWFEDESQGRSLSMIQGFDPDDLRSALGMLALDAIYGTELGKLYPLSHAGFEDQLSNLHETLRSEGLTAAP